MPTVAGHFERSALLFVRGTEHVTRALEAANMLRAGRRGALSLTGAEVLGIFVHEGLDTGLVAQDCLYTNSDGVALRESVGLNGIWTLCWFELPLTVGSPGVERRRLLLDTLLVNDLGDPASLAKRRLFFSVWTPAEALEDVTRGLRDLEARYAIWEIGREHFVDHPRGVVSMEPRPTAFVSGSASVRRYGS